MAHNGAIVPVPGRDIFVQAWYQGGISVIDFTDSENPVEIAYFDRGPINGDLLISGGYWSAYYYRGRIYGTEIVRGLDVFELDRNEFMSDNEIAAAALADFNDVFNPQQQLRVRWPAEPVVAKAYIDQLDRVDALDASSVRDLNRLLTRAEWQLEDGERDPELAARLTALAASLNFDVSDDAARRRANALIDVLAEISARLL